MNQILRIVTVTTVVLIFACCTKPRADSVVSIPLPVDTTSIQFDSLPTAEDFVAPGRGANTWYSDTQYVNVPDSSRNLPALDNDTRFLWSKLEPGVKGVYDWSTFDDQLKKTIDAGQKFSFGIMPVCSSCGTGPASEGNVLVTGYKLGYPMYIHQAMQADSIKDWAFRSPAGNIWVPNWNSEDYLANWENLLKALAAHIESSFYKGIPFSKAIYHIDIRGYGNWGEWHTFPWTDCKCIPINTSATNPTLKRIIDAYAGAFDNFPLITFVNVFTINPEIAYHALNLRNNWGYFGIRSDHLGSEETDSFVSQETIANEFVYNGIAIRDLILQRWKIAPICGEPLEIVPDVTHHGMYCPYYNLPNEVNIHHVSQFSNDFYLTWKNNCAGSNVRAAARAAGYRLQVSSGNVTPLVRGKSFTITMNWVNTGNAPVYEDWQVEFALKDQSGEVKWTGLSTINLRQLLPGKIKVTDHFNLPLSLSSGTYRMYLTVKDVNGYRKPLPLAITGKNGDGSYTISQSLGIQ